MHTASLFLEQASPGWDSVKTALALLLGITISVVFVFKLLLSDATPAATLNWVFVILLAPYVGIVLYYLFSHRLQLRRLKRRVSMSTMPADVEDPGGTAGCAHPTARFLRRLDPEIAQEGNRLVLHESGRDYFDALEAAILGARRFVHVETYICRPDRTGRRILGVLGEAARRGVEVRLLYDSIGSWSLKAAHLAGLHAAGGRAVPYLPLLWRRRPFTLNLRNHRKLAVIDGEVSFLGGRNIAEEYDGDRFSARGSWFDVMLAVRGPVVRPLHWVFAEDWYNAADEDLRSPRYFPRVGARGDACVGALASGPDRLRNPLRCVLAEMLAQARETIDISSPYLVPDPVMMSAFEVAAIRGVRIRLHTNGPKVEQFVLHHAARSLYRRLLALGVEVTETVDDYNHAKLFIVDGSQLYLGSANLDTRSFVLNFEVGAVVLDPELCRHALDLFERRRLQGRRVEPEDLPRGRPGRVVDGACRLLSPIL